MPRLGRMKITNQSFIAELALANPCSGHPYGVLTIFSSCSDSLRLHLAFYIVVNKHGLGLSTTRPANAEGISMVSRGRPVPDFALCFILCGAVIHGGPVNPKR